MASGSTPVKVAVLLTPGNPDHDRIARKRDSAGPKKKAEQMGRMCLGGAILDDAGLLKSVLAFNDAGYSAKDAILAALGNLDQSAPTPVVTEQKEAATTPSAPQEEAVQPSVSTPPSSGIILADVK